MISFFKGHQSKEQIRMTLVLFENALGDLKDYYCESDMRYDENGNLVNYTNKSCTGCPYRTLCTDLAKLVEYLRQITTAE